MRVEFPRLSANWFVCFFFLTGYKLGQRKRFFLLVGASVAVVFVHFHCMIWGGEGSDLAVHPVGALF